MKFGLCWLIYFSILHDFFSGLNQSIFFSDADRRAWHGPDLQSAPHTLSERYQRLLQKREEKFVKQKNVFHICKVLY